MASADSFATIFICINGVMSCFLKAEHIDHRQFFQILNPLAAMPPKTSGKAAAKSGKATKAVTKGDKKKRKGKRKESYAIYIYKVRLIVGFLTIVTLGPRC